MVKPIEELHRLYFARLKRKKKRGAIEFETTETRIQFNQNKKIENILPVVRNDAHKLIEECMICANVAAAKFFMEKKLPSLYRVHLGPKEKKLEVFRSYLAELGLFITGGSEPKAEIFRKFLEQIQDRSDAENIQIMLLRSMSQAVYSPKNEGHFGLAFNAYTHFTSPIRRYPDLIVHRIIKSQTNDEKFQSDEHRELIKTLYTEGKLSEIGQANSITERNADLATRDVMDWLKCEYMQSHIGMNYVGEVSSVTNFGLFIRLKKVFVEGLVHVTELGDDYYHYDQTKQRMIGERTGKSFSIGDEVEIQVASVDLDLRRIDFRLIDNQKVTGSKKKTEREKLYENAKRKTKPLNSDDDSVSAKNSRRSSQKKTTRKNRNKTAVVGKKGKSKKSKQSIDKSARKSGSTRKSR